MLWDMWQGRVGGTGACGPDYDFLALESSLISPSVSAFLQFRTKNTLIRVICILMCSFQKGVWELEQGALAVQ